MTPSVTPTSSATRTPTPSETPLPSLTEAAHDLPDLTPGLSAIATATPIPTNTLRATFTPIPTNTPRPTIPMPTIAPGEGSGVAALVTSAPTADSEATAPVLSIPPTATLVIEGTYAVPHETPIVPVPAQMPLLDTDPDVLNFLLLGSDTAGGGVGHTDVIILLSVNRRAGTVAMWHVPRDLIVYIPNYTMERINLAYALGEAGGYPGGGFGLMKETIRYNFGIEIDHFARVDFDDFLRIVEELGGLEVSVDCAISDWRLKSPELDPAVEENWEYYTLPIGPKRLTPYMALWYVRSRKTTSDLDRGRRQMDVLRAMWYQARQQGLFAQVTQLWPEAVEIIETDMALTDVLSLVPLAITLDMSNIARYSGVRGVHYIPYVTPGDGRDVVLPNREALLPMIADFLTPPTDNRLGRNLASVEVVDASGYGLGFDSVVVDRLAWEGFSARSVGYAGERPHDLTLIYDFTGQAKGSALDDLRRVLRVSEAHVVVQPDPNRPVDYRVEIGAAYNLCVYGNAEDEIGDGPPIPSTEP